MKSGNLKRSKTLEIFLLTAAVSLAAVVMLVAGCAHLDAIKYNLEPIPKLEVLDGVVRNTTGGQIEGRVDKSLGILAWEGVRYAKPPLGDLRWKAPREPESWTGVMETKKSGSICTQGAKGCEDCLFLNIYRPDTVEKNLPVYVWIHGGSNKAGRAVDLNYFAKDANVVTVAIQYRLGPFGFFKHDALNTGNALDDSGIYGILDQIQVLKWVRKNITSFGGDPHNVTVAGESAGAGNIYGLLIIKEARGLFHKAICQSPGPSNMTLAEAKNYSVGYVKKLGLTSEGEQLAKDLRAVKTQDLIKAAPRGVNFRTIVDGKFIKDPFFCMIESGDYTKVPIIIGGNKNEYSLWMLLGRGPKKKWGKLWRITSKKRPKKVDDILNAEEKKSYALTNAMGGKIWQALKGHRAARLLRKHQKDVYVYDFRWGGAKGTDVEFVFGAAHANEIAYFNYNATFDIWAKNRSITKETKAAREALAKAMRTYYAQFLHTGNPNGKAKIPDWKPWSNEKDGVKTLNLDASSEPGSSELKVFMTKREYVFKDILQEIEDMTDETAKKFSLKIVNDFINGWIKDVPCK
ncbi:MAG: carboxylesterase/lipase family protein [Deltaproteobacteria bacterium]|nr:carboxylesterase/lipase family protein [Deltaproteobacteria bacterium]